MFLGNKGRGNGQAASCAVAGYDMDGHGNHGEYRPEDINVMHFYGAYPKR